MGGGVLFLNIPKKCLIRKNGRPKKKPGPIFSVILIKMNTVLSVCSEYSDNVWYSGIEVDEGPSKIAIEIGREYRFAFLKIMGKIGYRLDSMKRGDSHYCVLTLVKSEQGAFCQ
jgi:hypothetical protein